MSDNRTQDVYYRGVAVNAKWMSFLQTGLDLLMVQLPDGIWQQVGHRVPGSKVLAFYDGIRAVVKNGEDGNT